MTETLPRIETQNASDGYPIQVAVWPVAEGLTVKGRILVVHGVQSHQGWYQRLGRTLSASGYETLFPDRRGSGANQIDRGHVRSTKRFIDDLAGQLEPLRRASNSPITLVGISWGGKIALVTASKNPALLDQIALICPGLHPRVGVTFTERLRIAFAYFTNRRKTFPVPLSDPALFTASPEGQAFIASDPLSLRNASAGLLAASTILDMQVRRAKSRMSKPILMMLAGRDRIVNNAKTLEFFQGLASSDKTLIEYPEGHHTLEFDPDPDQYALDLVHWIEQRDSR